MDCYSFKRGRDYSFLLLFYVLKKPRIKRGFKLIAINQVVDEDEEPVVVMLVRSLYLSS